MKIYALLLSLLIITSCTGKEDAMPQGREAVQTEARIKTEDSAAILNKLNTWFTTSLQKEKIDWSKLTLREIWKDDSTKAEAFLPGKDFYNDYSSVLRWSPDSNYVLDIGSYGSVLIKDSKGNTKVEAGEPDTEIFLIKPAQNQKITLLFAGPSSNIFNATWVDTENALILGSFDEHGNNQPDTLFWLINVKSNFYRMYKFR